MRRMTVWNPWGIIPKDIMDWDVDLPFSDDVQMDVYEEGDNVVVKLKAPGFKREDIKVQIESNVITISGSMKEGSEEKDSKKYYRKEIRMMSFTRSSDLPYQVDPSAAKATFKDGILMITLPKREEAKPRSIDIQVEE